MSLKQYIFNILKVIINGFSLITTFYMVVEFTYFLSISSNSVKITKVPRDPWLETSWSLLVNMFLLSLFILQHSLLSSSKIKDAFGAYGFQVIYRSLYVITTSGILMFMIKNWKSTPNAILWKFDINYRPIWWLYGGVHTTAWIIIYVGNICTDVTELLGIKQVYYDIVNLPDPNLRKSSRLLRLNSHMRHPSFLAFIFIFWIFPIMSLDRLLLATISTSYMYIAWNTDERDFFYQKSQYERKYHELERLQRYSY